ncbi:MAG: protein translocase subunit SecF, partial [Smithella sp.]|nr:protein translocase subunit SecF [Smithella sp.]
VVFDRIRENRKKDLKKSLAEIINSSVNETLSRTILTAFTVILVLLSLFFLGGPVIHDFAFALLVGVVIGTYSSIFIASPIVLAFENIQISKGKRKK